MGFGGMKMRILKNLILVTALVVALPSSFSIAAGNSKPAPKTAVKSATQYYGCFHSDTNNSTDCTCKPSKYGAYNSLAACRKDNIPAQIMKINSDTLPEPTAPTTFKGNPIPAVNNTNNNTNTNTNTNTNNSPSSPSKYSASDLGKGCFLTEGNNYVRAFDGVIVLDSTTYKPFCVKDPKANSNANGNTAPSTTGATVKNCYDNGSNAVPEVNGKCPDGTITEDEYMKGKVNGGESNAPTITQNNNQLPATSSAPVKNCYDNGSNAVPEVNGKCPDGTITEAEYFEGKVNSGESNAPTITQNNSPSQQPTQTGNMLSNPLAKSHCESDPNKTYNALGQCVSKVDKDNPLNNPTASNLITKDNTKNNTPVDPKVLAQAQSEYDDCWHENEDEPDVDSKCAGKKNTLENLKSPTAQNNNPPTVENKNQTTPGGNDKKNVVADKNIPATENKETKPPVKPTKEERKAEKSKERQNQIAVAGDAKAGDCGRYGAIADCSVTNAANGLVPVVDGYMSNEAANSVARTGEKANRDLIQIGAGAKQTDVNNAQISAIIQAKDGEEHTAKVDKGMAIGQALLGAMHFMSTGFVNKTARDAKDNEENLTEHKKEFKKNYAAAKKEVDKICETKNTQRKLEIAEENNNAATQKRVVSDVTIRAIQKKYDDECKQSADTSSKIGSLYSDAQDTAKSDATETVKANIENNRKVETGEQKLMGAKQIVESMKTLTLAKNHENNALAGQAAIDNIQQTTTTTGGGFYLNTNTGTGEGTQAVDNMPSQESAIVADTATTTGSGGELGADPVLQNTNTDPTGADKFVGAPPPGGGGSGGGGLGSAGGTSAGKGDDNKGAGEAPSKSQVGGSYASDGSGSSGYRRGGGGSGVATDPGILDMMKKLLDGGDPKKDLVENKINLEDRSPASDQAAVLGRNQNIFEAIHKRYQKKNTEGAVIFGGGST